MKSLAWKLATVAAVIGIGCLVMLQAQRGMNQAAASRQGESTPDSPFPVAKDSSPPADAKSNDGKLAEQKPPDDAKKPDPFGELAATTPPPGSPSTVKPALVAPPTLGQTEPLEKSGKELDSKKVETEIGGASVPVRSASRTSSDPFAEPAATKQAEPVPTQIKQAGGVSESKPDAKSPPSLELPSDSPPRAIASVATSQQKEPGESPPDPARSGGSNANSPGPQLLPPTDGQSTPPADNNGAPAIGPTTTTPSRGKLPWDAEGDGKKDSTSSDASPNGRRDVKGGTQKSGSDPLLLPDGEGTPTPKDRTAPPSEDRNGSNQRSAVRGTKGSESLSPAPALFPSGDGKELPAPAPKEIPPNGSSIGQASGGASDGGRAGASGVRAEPGPDFQGDGTVGDSAPLGPQRPQLSIEKIAPQNALLKQPLIYSILVKNVGSVEAREVVVDDRIPKGTKLSGTIPRAELTGKKLSWRLGNLGPGEQRKIQIRVIPMEPGEIGSVATVNFVAEAAAETVVTAPKLEFQLTAQSSARLGQLVPFRFQVKNVGTGEARGVVIRDVIPEGLSHSAGKDLEYEIGRLPAGQSKDLTLELKAVKVGPVTNRALATAEGGVSAEAKATLEITGTKVAITRSGPARRYLGRPALYTNTIVNESKFDVEGVAIVEQVPAGMEFAAATHGGQYNDSTRTIAWRIERMAPAETRVVQARLIPKAPGTQTSTVRVVVPNGETSEITGETLVEGFAALSLEMAPLESPIDVGERLTLQINARNKGTIAATNVLVSVDIPDRMTIVSARGPGKPVQEGNHLKFGPIPSLDGRTAAACEIVVEAKKRGDSRIAVSVRADQLEKPLSREESVLVLSEGGDSSKPR